MTKQTNPEVGAKPTRRIFSGTEKRRILTAADAFDKWLVAVEATLLPSDPLMVAIRYNRRHREALYRFIDDADVPIDNSPPRARVSKRRQAASEYALRRQQRASASRVRVARHRRQLPRRERPGTGVCGGVLAANNARTQGPVPHPPSVVR